MKNIVEHTPSKYTDTSLYTSVEDGIFEYDNPPDEVLEQPDGIQYRYGVVTTSRLEAKYFVTSLSFEQEPDKGEGATPSAISQYPLEDILDTYNVWVSDFYTKENEASTTMCYLEFGASRPQRLKDLRTIIGKHVYNQPSSQDNRRIDLVIE